MVLKNISADILFKEEAIFFIENGSRHLYKIDVDSKEIKVLREKFNYLFFCGNLIHKRENIFIDDSSFKELTLDFSKVDSISSITFLSCYEENAIFKNVNIALEKVSYYLLKSTKEIEKLNSSIRLPKVLNKNNIFCINKNYLICHPLSTGEELWRIDVGALGRHELMYEGSGEWVEGKVVFLEAFAGVLCVVLGNDMLLGVDIANGNILWQRQMPVRIITAPLFDSGCIYWFSLSNPMQYIVVDILTGNDAQPICTLQPPFRAGLVFTQPTLANDKILMTADNSRTIFIVNSATGAVLNTVQLEGEGSRIPVANAPQQQGNRLFQLDGDQTLHIFEWVD